MLCCIQIASSPRLQHTALFYSLRLRLNGVCEPGPGLFYRVASSCLEHERVEHQLWELPRMYRCSFNE